MTHAVHQRDCLKLIFSQSTSEFSTSESLQL